jgi:hypothetical protein
MMSKISRAVLYEQLERDVAWRKEQDRVWTEFLDVLTGGGLEVPDEMLDEEEKLEEEWGTMRDGMRRFNRGRP